MPGLVISIAIQIVKQDINDSSSLSNAILQEDSFFILQEDGSYILQEG